LVAAVVATEDDLGRRGFAIDNTSLVFASETTNAVHSKSPRDWSAMIY
jgi:hypothetical protein